MRTKFTVHRVSYTSTIKYLAMNTERHMVVLVKTQSIIELVMIGDLCMAANILESIFDMF